MHARLLLAHACLLPASLHSPSCLCGKGICSSAKDGTHDYSSGLGTFVPCKEKSSATVFAGLKLIVSNARYLVLRGDFCTHTGY